MTKVWLPLALLLVLALAGCSRSSSSSVDPALKHFAEEKKAATRAWARDQSLSMPREAWSFFDAAAEGRWQDATNSYGTVRRLGGFVGSSGQQGWWRGFKDLLQGAMAKLGYKPKPPAFLQAGLCVPLQDIYGAMEQFRVWDNHLLHLYGDTVISSIPSNSIYFGGTDAGRFVISALCESQQKGQPFFTLTQNAVADGTYLLYLQKLYGARIAVPGATESQKAFTTYLSDAQLRLQQHRLKPGESVMQSGGRVTVSGLTAVMQINALLVRAIFEKNPTHEFYFEESTPLDWMYPYLSPQGPVLKLNRQPLTQLPADLVQQDRDYWKHLSAQLIGNTATNDTSLADTCAFVRRVYINKDLAGFTGNPRYVRNPAAQDGFSSLRKGIAGVYAWRADQTQLTEERETMCRAAEQAYLQAFALGPGNPAVVEPFVDFLLAQHRPADALTLVQLSLAVNPGNPKVAALLQSLTQK